jgi:hypothetical protein
MRYCVIRRKFRKQVSLQSKSRRIKGIEGQRKEGKEAIPVNPLEPV